MRISFLQLLFLILLFLILFYNKLIFNNQIGSFFTTFIKNIKKHNSFRKH